MEPVSDYNEHYISYLFEVIDTEKNKKLNPDFVNSCLYPLQIWEITVNRCVRGRQTW